MGRKLRRIRRKHRNALKVLNPKKPLEKVKKKKIATIKNDDTFQLQLDLKFIYDLSRLYLFNNFIKQTKNCMEVGELDSEYFPNLSY